MKLHVDTIMSRDKVWIDFSVLQDTRPYWISNPREEQSTLSVSRIEHLRLIYDPSEAAARQFVHNRFTI